jgi:hypothetical protein
MFGYITLTLFLLLYRPPLEEPMSEDSHTKVVLN